MPDSATQSINSKIDTQLVGVQTSLHKYIMAIVNGTPPNVDELHAANSRVITIQGLSTLRDQ